jgi:hypothetical protein
VSRANGTGCDRGDHRRGHACGYPVVCRSVWIRGGLVFSGQWCAEHVPPLGLRVIVVFEYVRDVVQDSRALPGAFNCRGDIAV